MWYTEPADMYLTEWGLFFTNDSNHIRMNNGTDKINFGDGDLDSLEMSLGRDIIAFGGPDDKSEIITFDNAGYGSNAFTNSSVYIRADTPESNSKITIRANDVVIQLN